MSDSTYRPLLPSGEGPEARHVVKALQYAYYILNDSPWSDYDYDMFCSRHGIPGGGGSDLATDYNVHDRSLAREIRENPERYKHL